MCDHQWPKSTKMLKWPDGGQTMQCSLCKAVGLFDTERDPFGQESAVILRPPQEEWRGLSRAKRHVILDENKYHIMKDVRMMGKGKTLRKWSLAPSTLYVLLASWQYGENPKADIPLLPAFNNDWTPEVQVKWLEIYKNVSGSRREG